MFLYLPVKQKLWRPDIGKYTAFGILCVRLDLLRYRKFAEIKDVSLSYREAAALALCCTQGQLAPSQLQDVVEDFLCR